MPACDAYIPEGTLRPSPGGRVVTLPGIAARLIGYAARRCSRGVPQRRRERAHVLAESAQGTASA
jgi:hypothetical protein